MTSVYRTLGSSAFSLYILNHNTLSATDFLQSDELSFGAPKQVLDIMKSFGDNKALNKAFNSSYQRLLREYDKKFDGDAHFGLMFAALVETIENNRRLFPADAIDITINLGQGQVLPFHIPSLLEMSGRLFKADQQQRVADYEAQAARDKELEAAQSAKPDDPAHKAFATLLAIIAIQQKDQEQQGDVLQVVLKDAINEAAGTGGAATVAVVDGAAQQNPNLQTIAKAIAASEAKELAKVNEAYGAV